MGEKLGLGDHIPNGLAASEQRRSGWAVQPAAQKVYGPAYLVGLPGSRGEAVRHFPMPRRPTPAPVLHSAENGGLSRARGEVRSSGSGVETMGYRIASAMGNWSAVGDWKQLEALSCCFTEAFC
ncbi:hypothetical protein H920_02999 [Fukomys damarensis]|uniref:Uncharacterized protein n=1 Tax=Fukomys damarensis TaxID=885580 RepID=A0A091DWZ4_FUKDA|nr:hypothetical protein H920_02999 [Fukomys damarensis]